jgi:putative peptidoglycan lipid II flippase
MEPNEPRHVGGAIARNTVLLLAVTLAFKLLGFLEKVLLASQFGTGPQVEAYLIAFSVPFGLAIVLRDLLEPSLLPVFLRLRDHASDQARAWRLTSLLAMLIALGLLLIITAGVASAGALAHLLAPGFRGERVDLTARLLRWLMPSLLFLGLANLTGTLLHADKRFVLPAGGEVVFRSGPVLGLLSGGGLVSLTAGVLVGSLGKLTVQAAGLRHQWLAFVQGMGKWDHEVKTVGALAAPLSVGLLLTYVGTPLAENAFASFLPTGSVASLTFARKIAETLGSILPYALGIVAFPYFAQLQLAGDNKAMERTLEQVLRAILFFFMPATVGLLLLRVPVVQLLFQRGAFGAEATRQTAWPLLFYTLGLIPMAMEPVLVHFYFAQQDTVTPIVWDVISFVAGVLLMFLLLRPLGVGGVALATATAKAVKVGALMRLVRRRFPGWRPSRLTTPAGQLAIACLAMGLVVLAASAWWTAHPLLNGTAGVAAQLFVTTLLGGLTFLAMGWALKIEEWQLVIAQTRAYLSRPEQ